jgi:hypothetical protein
MPVLVAWIGAALARIFATRLGSWIAGALLFLGLSWGTTAVSMAGTKALIASTIGSISGTSLEWLVFFNVPRYLSIIISAYGAAAAVGGAKRVFLMKSGGGGSSPQ